MTDSSGYAEVGGLRMYWESRGEGGTPIVVAHGGLETAAMSADLLDQLATRRRVVAVELQGHGHTADIDRPLRFETLGDDIVAVAGELGLGQVDLLGYSLGGSSSLRAAIQHPDVVRRLAVVAVPCRRDGWFADVRDGMDGFDSSLFELMKQAPSYAAYQAVAPDTAAFPALMDKVAELLRRPYDWSAEIEALKATTLLVYADADSIPVSHMAEFYALLGGGLRDGSWDRSGMGVNRLAVLPGLTHYDIFGAPALVPVLDEFFG